MGRGGISGEDVLARPYEETGSAESSFWPAASVLIMLVLAVLDSSALQVALPRMMDSLSVSAATSVWVLISFQIGLVAFILPCSVLADCFGYRRVFLIGGAIFVTASGLCAASAGIVQICLARALQGIGAAAIYSTNPSIIRLIFPGRRLSRGIALSSMTNALSLALGPAIGSALLLLGSWHLIFLINLPLGVVGLVTGSKCLPSSEHQRLVPVREGVDLPSMGLSLLFLPCIVFASENIASDMLQALFWLSAGLIAGVLLWKRQRRLMHQMLPLGLFRIPVFSLSLVCSAFGFMALAAAYTSLPFMLTFADRVPLAIVALYMTIPPIMTAIGNALVIPLARYFNEIHSCGLGMVCMAAGLAGIALGQLPGWWIICGLTLLGLGFGLFQTPNNRMILGAADPSRSGNVSGTLAVVRTLGQTGGTSLVSVALAWWGMVGSVHALAIAALAALFCGAIGLTRLWTGHEMGIR